MTVCICRPIEKSDAERKIRNKELNSQQTKYTKKKLIIRIDRIENIVNNHFAPLD